MKQIPGEDEFIRSLMLIPAIPLMLLYLCILPFMALEEWYWKRKGER